VEKSKSFHKRFQKSQKRKKLLLELASIMSLCLRKVTLIL
jgi:hypothetical protein